MRTRTTLITSLCQVATTYVILAIFASIAAAQTIPILNGEIETVWTSDRTSWLEGPSFDGTGGIWFGDPGDILTGFAEPSRLLRYDTSTGQTSIEIDVDVNAGGTVGRIWAVPSR